MKLTNAQNSTSKINIGLIVIYMLLLVACGGGSGGGGTTSDTTPPTVISTSPTNNATGVAVSTVITATFSESVDPATVNASTFTLDHGGTGTISYDSVNKIAAYTPSSNLTANTLYTATISTGVKDLAGNAVAANYNWTFTSGNAAPTVISTSPTNNATGVAVSTVIAATFSESVDPATVNASTFTLDHGGTGTISYDSVNKIAAYTPSSNLTANTLYTATISTGVKDLAGNTLASPYTWTFTTRSSSGSLDISFGNGGVVTTPVSGGNDWANALAIQSDGRIVVAGIANSGSGSSIVRYNQDGSLDTTFGGTGMVSSAVTGTMAIAIQPDAKIVVAGGAPNGSNFDFAVARYNSDGSPDTSFGSGGAVITAFSPTYDDMARAVGIQSDGKIVVAGYISDSVSTYDFFSPNYNFAVARYNPNGSLDTGFGSGGKVITDFGSSRHDDAYALGIQIDGKIVVIGSSVINPGTVSTNSDIALARYNTDGSLDTSFGGSGTVLTDYGSNVDEAYAVAIQSNGKIVVAGSSQAYDFAVARYNTNGILDSSFGTSGVVITPVSSSNDWARALGIQSDGKIVAAGIALNGINFDFALVRYNSDGSLDTGFGSGGIVVTDLGSNNDEAYALGIQSNGEICVAGRTTLNGNYDIAVVRYWP